MKRVQAGPALNIHYQQFFTRLPIEVPGPEGQLDDGELADIKAYVLLL